MAVASLLLSFAAGGLTVLGLAMTLVPVWGAVVAFAAPVSALAGLITGGLALSQAGREQRSKDFPVVAVVFNILALLPALLVAMTCGVCNAVGSSGPVELHRTGSFRVHMGFPDDMDGGWPRGLEPPAPWSTGPAGDAGAAADSVPLSEEDGVLPPPPLPAGPKPKSTPKSEPAETPDEPASADTP